MVRALRAPRTVLGVGVGIALGIAGALMQGHTRNPLADPGLLGVSAGAAFLVVVGIYGFGVTSLYGYVWFAFAGAFAASVAVFLLGAVSRDGPTPVTLALAGVADHRAARRAADRGTDLRVVVARRDRGLPARAGRRRDRRGGVRADVVAPRRRGDQRRRAGHRVADRQPQRAGLGARGPGRYRAGRAPAGRPAARLRSGCAAAGRRHRPRARRAGRPVALRVADHGRGVGGRRHGERRPDRVRRPGRPAGMPAAGRFGAPAAAGLGRVRVAAPARLRRRRPHRAPRGAARRDRHRDPRRPVPDLAARRGARL